MQAAVAEASRKTGISQSNLVVGAIILAFIAWVTLRGNLKNYLSDLGFGSATSSTSATTTSGSGSASSSTSAGNTTYTTVSSTALTGTSSAGTTAPASTDAGATKSLSNFESPSIF